MGPESPGATGGGSCRPGVTSRSLSGDRSILADVHFSELTPVQQRVLGCLIEKRWTTPDQYPLSLNALRLACNQSTNRDPVTRYDESEVREAAERLSRYGLARAARGGGARGAQGTHPGGGGPGVR